MSDVILYEVREGVAHVTLNRPDRMNSLTNDLLDALPVALKRAANDPDAAEAAMVKHLERSRALYVSNRQATR